MAQWLDLPDGLRNKIYQYIDDDNWKLYSLLSVSRNWWKTDVGVTRCQLGTIVLKPFGFPYSLYVQQFGIAFATLMKFANHHNDHNISPDQYISVEEPRYIRRFTLINSQYPR